MVEIEPQLPFKTLLSQERGVFRLVARHLCDKENARLLKLSPRTVHVHALKGHRHLVGLSRRDTAQANPNSRPRERGAR